ncbi:MAG: S-layer homology domain-containing protein [Hominilimicola sp.]
MNKNLKKVISAVAALSLSASSIAALAVNFPDVEDTASYSQAVQELSALDVISGYDDGTFKPDNLVTRAEISKMIVDALAEGKEAAASSVSSKFNDVNSAGEGGHWATGYINQGVSDGWISGYSDTEFGPDDNVTYVQAQKMLVAATGYDIYATAKGGWPAGYKLYASSLDITKGVQGVTSDDQQLTRAQVAQMIDNAMDAPLCKIDDWKIEWNGSKTPVLDVKDGEGKDYQTLFTEKHDAYKVYGRVTATSKTNSSLDTDKVEFKVEKADNFDDIYVKSTDDREPDEMYYGDTDAENMLRTYAQALIRVDDDDEYHILSIVAAAANKTVDLLAEDIDDTKSDPDGKVLYFYPTGTNRGSVKYQLADSVKYFVNGVAVENVPSDVDSSLDKYVYDKYIVDNDTALVKLQKETETGSTSTSSKYNVIMITTFATAVVEQVVDKTNETAINFQDYNDVVKSQKMTLKKDDDTKKYTFTLNDEVIDPADLQEYDVLTISYDPDDFSDSSFYEVQVSRDNTAQGKYTGQNSAKDEFTIGGTKYKAASGMDFADYFESSTEYTIYLDVFGRIAYADEVSNVKKIGILRSVYRKTNGDYVAEVITKDGNITEYDIDYDPSSNMGAKDVAVHFEGTETDGTDYDANLGKTGDDFVNQVVEYNTTTSGKFTIKKFLAPEKGGDGLEYKSSTEKLGSISVSDATTFIDVQDVTSSNKNDFRVVSKDSLKNGAYYEAYAYDKSNTSSTYSFVLIVNGGTGIDSKSQLAVFLESASDTNSDDEDVKTITLYVEGSEDPVTLFVDGDKITDDEVEAFEEGDLFVYATNSANEIDTIESVFSTDGMLNSKTFEAFRTLAYEDSSQILRDIDWVNDVFGNDGDEDNVNIKFGAVVREGKNSSVYTLAPVEDGKVDFTNPENIDLSLSSDTIYYSYNFAGRSKDFGRFTVNSGMLVTPRVTNAFDEDEKIYDLTNDQVSDDVVFAVVRTFDDDDAQEVYLIYND